jgi:hypothetical protein
MRELAPPDGATTSFDRLDDEVIDVLVRRAGKHPPAVSSLRSSSQLTCQFAG